MLHNKKFLDPEDPKYTVYKASEFKSLKDFIIAKYPYDIEIINDKVDTIYGYRPLPRAVLYTPLVNRSSEAREYALTMKKLGRKFAGKLNVFLQDADGKTARRFRLEGDATYIIFDTDKSSSKYRYTGKTFNESIDVDALIEFSQQFLDGKAPKYIRTAELNKDDLDEPVYPVVAKTYDSVVKDPKKHVFIRFYDKMMQRYSDQFQMRKEWWKVGKNLTNNDKDILISEIETNDNDIDDFFIKEMANSHFYFMLTKKEKKTPYVYTGPINATDIIAFAHATIKKDDVDHKEDL
jgi:hypothetical protein